jgi:hypothetical protein
MVTNGDLSSSFHEHLLDRRQLGDLFPQSRRHCALQLRHCHVSVVVLKSEEGQRSTSAFPIPLNSDNIDAP